MSFAKGFKKIAETDAFGYPVGSGGHAAAMPTKAQGAAFSKGVNSKAADQSMGGAIGNLTTGIKSLFGAGASTGKNM